MTNEELFESIQNNHKEKKIISLSKKLTKKCSFDSGSDIDNLCRLAYWLFVYGYENEAISVCQITHNVVFPGKGKWDVWDFIMYMWGLEVHIFKCRNDNEKANDIISKMDNLWMSPPIIRQREPAQELERRNRFTLSYCSNEDKIERESSEVYANEWRLIALFQLVGYTSTGLFPGLNSEKDSVDRLVEEYIDKLKLVK